MFKIMHQLQFDKVSLFKSKSFYYSMLGLWFILNLLQSRFTELLPVSQPYGNSRSIIFGEIFEFTEAIIVEVKIKRNENKTIVPNDFFLLIMIILLIKTNLVSMLQC